MEARPTEVPAGRGHREGVVRVVVGGGRRRRGRSGSGAGARAEGERASAEWDAERRGNARSGGDRRRGGGQSRAHATTRRDAPSALPTGSSIRAAAPKAIALRVRLSESDLLCDYDRRSSADVSTPKPRLLWRLSLRPSSLSATARWRVRRWRRPGRPTWTPPRSPHRPPPPPPRPHLRDGAPTRLCDVPRHEPHLAPGGFVQTPFERGDVRSPQRLVPAKRLPERFREDEPRGVLEMIEIRESALRRGVRRVEPGVDEDGFHLGNRRGDGDGRSSLVSAPREVRVRSRQDVGPLGLVDVDEGVAGGAVEGLVVDVRPHRAANWPPGLRDFRTRASASAGLAKCCRPWWQ